jgi:glycolate oxidase FAD binding subunit
MTLGALQRHLAPHGQRVALDPPWPERATVGGILAANAFGPRRSRYGAPRDLVIGMTVIRADGVIARGGGKVVKNVAGFDLPRLLCGSLGTLGLIAEVVFRLHPLPEASATVAFADLSAREVLALTRAALDARLEPAAVVALEELARFRLLLRFEGFGPGVQDQAARALEVGERQGRAGERLEGEAEARAWAGYDALRTAGDVRAKAGFEPAALAEISEALQPLVASLRGGALVLHPTLGLAFATGTLDEAPDAAAAIEAARDAVAAAGGSVVLTEAPAALRALVDPWGRTPAALEVMRSLKRELDPEARLAPGRFAGGI